MFRPHHGRTSPGDQLLASGSDIATPSSGPSDRRARIGDERWKLERTPPSKWLRPENSRAYGGRHTSHEPARLGIASRPVGWGHWDSPPSSASFPGLAILRAPGPRWAGG